MSTASACTKGRQKKEKSIVAALYVGFESLILHASHVTALECRPPYSPLIDQRVDEFVEDH